ncbi:GNAT family protein [Novosphingobium sp. SG707]|uniref:GNAT family N-acetyltransferase n=1 Tax=Novosphingobium sp. SG707 TaxID=2586996 RepID=UPI0014473C89|nr:GNAT family protein [Novosphingobium sp. SG707]NKI98034.1 RimJ/RimL family protein N-acetyltransferase [Novosphingobium sp. SG707]
MIVATTDRLTLRQFREGDGPALFAYLHKPRVSCFASMAVADEIAAEAEARIRAAAGDYVAVCRRDTGQLIGDLFMEREGDTVSIGWHFNPDHTGAGFAFEASRALIDNLFSSQGVRRIYAYVEDDNVGSQRLCERLGMRREGLFLEFASFIDDADGQPIFENTFQYAMLSKEWPSQGNSVATA